MSEPRLQRCKFCPKMTDSWIAVCDDCFHAYISQLNKKLPKGRQRYYARRHRNVQQSVDQLGRDRHDDDSQDGPTTVDPADSK